MSTAVVIGSNLLNPCRECIIVMATAATVTYNRDEEEEEEEEDLFAN